MPGCHGVDHVDSQEFAELAGVCEESAAPSLVFHVETQDQGDTHLGQLSDKKETAFKVLGVRYLQDSLGPTSKQNIASCPLIFRKRDEGLNSGGVNENEALAFLKESTLSKFDRGSWIIGNGHVPTCQGAKKGALAYIGIAHEDDLIILSRYQHFSAAVTLHKIITEGTNLPLSSS